ncbi:protein of unknown function [Halopseudomonas litoralis]|uniref:DUF4224 domain-containing protein n=1 Tax=Halopseudomonas litoralis TaxID=797277 RepID=A0A1H1QL68_9GAMM|nr:DUF4224 domain-containing protein [Halopseudomonas litoralis]SDS24077.1 protein of unknown function [Halopseudomonas litoralis]
MFLTHEELCDLTGAKQKAGQLANLRQNGIRHTIKKSGWPSVTKAAVEQRPEKAAISEWKPRKAS